MDFVKPFFAGKHWAVQLVWLVLFVFLFGVVFSGLGELIAYALFHTLDMYKASSPADYIRVVQTFSSVGMFLVPALLFAYCQDKKWLNYESANRKPHYLLVNVTLLLSIVILPLVAVTEQWNQSLQLPESMANVQQWMRSMEDRAEEMMTFLTFEHSTGTLILNLLVMAALPAICEEFLFRGTIQSFLMKQTGKPHLAIWISAFVFSAIHFQFFGFVPRFLLGAYLGYLFYWSRSLWLPILAHFLHNALSLIISYSLQGRGIMADEVEFTEISGARTLAISCAVVAAMSLVFMWKTQKELNKD